MTLIYFIIILGVTLTVHEFGHFLFAKKSGIYCYEFSIGMGPKLHEWHRMGLKQLTFISVKEKWSTFG